MCLLAVCSPDSTPKKKDLECASCNNPHGFGFAVIAGDQIITGRGMSAKKVIRRFLEVRKQHPSSWALFHARYATHGVKNEDNCHPFKVPSNPDTYLAHNGILDVHIPAGDKRSDTRVFAEDVLPAMGGVTALDNDDVWKMVSKFAIGSKVAILTLDPNAKEQCYIINEDAGHWDNDGMWWSNNGYKQASSWSSYVGMPAGTYNPIVGTSVESEDYECPNCLTITMEDSNPYFCEVCTMCFDCSGTYGDTCMCWSPEYDKYASNKRETWYYDKHFDFAK